MAKKPLETGAPKASAVKKTAARKTAAKKTASTAKKAAADGKKTAVDSASVEAPKTKIKTVKSSSKVAVKTKTAKTAKKAVDEKLPAAGAVVPSASLAPSAPVEKEMVSEDLPKSRTAASVRGKRESFRPTRNTEQQERHELQGGDAFVLPETVGGASEISFNKRKRRRRNRKSGGSEDRQPMQDATSLKQLDCKKMASRAWKIFLAEVSEEGLALMDDQTAREAARRAFRCAEFFMMEEVRRKHARKDALHRQEKVSSSEEERDSKKDSGEE